MAAVEMLREKRVTRGIRKNALAGEDEEFDQEFYGSEFWLEGQGSDEESYDGVEEEAPLDEFDSDFNDTEDDEEEDESDEEDGRKRSRRKESSEPKASNKYREPKIVETKRKVTFSDDGIANVKRRKISSHPSTVETSAPRALRDSTKSKSLDTEVSESLRKEAAELRQKQQQRLKQREKIKHQFEQRELLNEGLTTEISNLKWIENRKALAKEDEAVAEKSMKQKLQKEACIRHMSKRGQYNMIVFPSTESMPSILTQGDEANPTEKPQVRDFKLL
jgi:hypothetical protein